MRILFWNTHKKKDINPYIASLVLDNEIDILALSEYDANIDELNAMFKDNNQRLIKCNTLGCDRIDVWSSYVNIKSGIQEKYYSIQIMYDIHKIEDIIQTQRTIVIGDINEMPYGRGCLNANGFHGLPALNISDKPTRTVNEIEYRKFYNPMWNLMGDFDYPPGTFYVNQSKLHSPMWYMLDQVIISQSMIPFMIKEELKIIVKCKNKPLYTKNGYPNSNISDHFPIVCEFKV